MSFVSFFLTVGMRGTKFIFCLYRKSVRSLGCERVSDILLPIGQTCIFKIQIWGVEPFQTVI
jgi:hypothetical protein